MIASGYNGIYFLHVPKTAGTAFNDTFRKSVPEDRFFEHMESRPMVFENVTRDGIPFFASGHFTYEATKELIVRRDVFSITILRNPVLQLVSHLKWVKAYGDPSEPQRILLIPEEIADLSRKLWSTSLNDVDSLLRILDSPVAIKLFDNLQVRYLTNQKSSMIELHDLRKAKENITHFDLAFTLDDIARGCAYIQEVFPNVMPIARKNESRISEDVRLDIPEIRDFYRSRVRYDAGLFVFLRDHSQAKLRKLVSRTDRQ